MAERESRNVDWGNVNSAMGEINNSMPSVEDSLMGYSTNNLSQTGGEVDTSEHIDGTSSAHHTDAEAVTSDPIVNTTSAQQVVIEGSTLNPIASTSGTLKPRTKRLMDYGNTDDSDDDVHIRKRYKVDRRLHKGVYFIYFILSIFSFILFTATFINSFASLLLCSNS